MGHGLRHPGDLVAWRRWHESRHPVRAARSRLRPTPETVVDVLTPSGGGDLLVAVEATHASVDRAVVAPLRHLPAERTSIVCPTEWQPPEGYAAHDRRTIALDAVAAMLEPTAVLAAGHYTEIGAAAFALAELRGVPFLVSQHGALTPFAPPLPRAARLLAWSEADAGFWTTGRDDVRVTVSGSQLLWKAGLRTSAATGGAGPLTYLGQGHAAEIGRARLVHAALSTCREHGAVYRPHPSERDLASRAALAAYERAGITVDDRGVPLVELTSPIVSVFSTGVLEAAARGLGAWVDFPRPPAWLGEFWERYGMRRLGNDPTTAPARPDLEPARRIAEIVTEAAR
ncbi:RNA-binding protein [Nocardioides currus]|uniref:RNA-binding protein n=1 Tax=Nocardioides currus TaxID=2133958 RepID=A0A2R7YZS0_9ACTN|nr:RNA-binding protein [Nocardioides currus]PUA81526.1 RNA-binding protein [Nocardioides currus]